MIQLTIVLFVTPKIVCVRASVFVFFLIKKIFSSECGKKTKIWQQRIQRVLVCFKHLERARADASLNLHVSFDVAKFVTILEWFWQMDLRVQNPAKKEIATATATIKQVSHGSWTMLNHCSVEYVGRLCIGRKLKNECVLYIYLNNVIVVVINHSPFIYIHSAGSEPTSSIYTHIFLNK